MVRLICFWLLVLLVVSFSGQEACTQKPPSPGEMLYEGAYRGKLALLQKAVDQGANIDTRYSDNTTALMLAAESRSPEAFEFLLKQKPNLHLRDTSGNSVMHCVAGNGSYYTDEMKKLGTEAAVRLAEARKYKMMELLIAARGNVNARNNIDETPLMTYVHFIPSEPTDTPSRLELLLKHGAALGARNTEGKTALHIAVEEGHSDQIRVLLQYHANPNRQDNEGRTPLLLARDYEAFKMLLDNGARVNIRDNAGRTPLLSLWAEAVQSYGDAFSDNESEYHAERVAFPDERELQLLLSKRADVNAADYEGKSALQMAQSLVESCRDTKNHKEAERYVALLRKAGAKK